MDQNLPLHGNQVEHRSGCSQKPILQCEPSTLMSHVSPDCGEALPESSRNSVTSLKEHDYIGLAEIASSRPPLDDEPEDATGLTISEPDLRLELGLPNRTSVEKVAQPAERPSFTCLHVADIHDTARPPSSSARHGRIPMGFADSMAIPHGNSHPNLTSKSSCKRHFTEAMVDALRKPAPVVKLIPVPACFNPVDSRSASIRSWQCSNEPQGKPFPSLASSGVVPPCLTKGDGDDEVRRHSNLDLKLQSDGSKVQSLVDGDGTSDEALPAKGQVVGWPPVRSYRRSVFAASAKSDADGLGSQSTTFVKVNMDGIPVGRKVDLSAYKSYESLLSALEDMFRNSGGGCGTQFSKGADFVLTYEDKEGDWMLVGDVPWELFVKAVRRLRITRGSEMAAPGKVI